MRDNAVEIAAVAAEAGFQTVQLVLHKAIRNVKHQAGDLSEQYCRKMGKAFIDQGLEIALLGAYFNWFTDTDRQGERKYLEHLKFARFFGTEIVGTEVQSPSVEKKIQNPEHKKEEVQNQLYTTARTLCAEAEEQGVYAGFEGAWPHVLSSPQEVCKLVERLSSDHIALIFDLYNFLNIKNYQNQHRIIDTALDCYGDRLKVIHCKDFIVQQNQLIQVAPGKGLFDYPYLIKRLKAKGHDDIPLILEGVTGEDIVESSIFLKKFL